MNKKILSILLGATFSILSFGYENNKDIKVEKVHFKNNQITMTGNLYYPKNFEKDKKYPTITVAHPWGGVKEQTAGLYAQKLAEKGFITLAYDATHYGESGGEPRYLENPSERVEDIRCTVDYLTTLPFVDEEKIGALGICAGGGYTISAAQTDLRIKAVAGISTYDVGDAARNGLKGVYSVSYADRMQILKEAGEQRTKEARGENVRIDKLMPPSAPSATAPQFLRESYDYYETERGHHENATGNFKFTSNIHQMEFFPFSQIETISPRPLLLIAGAKAQTLYFSEEAYKKANEPKELFIVEGATHFDMYDKPEFVTPAVEKLEEFFNTNLK